MSNTSSTKAKQLVGKVNVSFAAIDQYVESNIIRAEEKEVTGKDFISWGDGNKYPDYLYGLYNDVTLLRTIIMGIGDYAVGDGVKSNNSFFEDEEMEDIVKKCAIDYMLYGGFALDVERNKIGGLAKIYYIDFKKLRSDKKNEFIYYSEDWSKSAGRVKCTKYSKYRKDGQEASSIFYFKNSYTQTYPLSPLAGDGAVAAETIKAISEFHFNAICNGFSSNYIINFNNGQPDDEQKEEIEDNFSEKFGGYQNAGRPMLSFNEDTDHQTTITKVDSDNFDEKYQALKNNSRQVIFTCFKSNPILFGIPTENNGFASDDYDQAFKLFNRTVIRPVQKVICNAFDKIIGKQDTVAIKPFSIDWAEDENNEQIVK